MDGFERMDMIDNQLRTMIEEIMSAEDKNWDEAKWTLKIGLDYLSEREFL